MSLCGHGTIAALYALKTRNMLSNQVEPLDLVVETQAGLLPMSIRTSQGRSMVRMRQAPAEFRHFSGSRELLINALGLDVADLAADLPIVYASTGTWTLLVPIRSLESFSRMVAQNERFPEILQELPRCSVHPFCLQTHEPEALMHGRHFSSPFASTQEDPVTGTASGAMGAYYVAYVQPHERLYLVVEQGNEIGRDGRVIVDVERSSTGIQVAIEGTAVYEQEWEVEEQQA